MADRPVILRDPVSGERLFPATLSSMIYNEDGTRVDMTKYLQMDLLWTNASPSSEFAAQMITLDLSNYDIVFIIGFMGNDIFCQLPLFVSVGSNSRFEYTNGVMRSRRVFTNNNYVQFEDSTTQSTFGSQVTTVVNTACIPYRIYGIKGVKLS